MRSHRVEVRADAELRRHLAGLLPSLPVSSGAEPEPELEPAQADALLARIVWSRVVEPGDAVAGILIACLGAGRAIDLVASGASGSELCTVLQGHGEDRVTARQAAAAVKRWVPRLDRAAVVEDITRARACGIRTIVPGEEQWPDALDDLGAHAPLMLWVRGDTALLRSPALAVVGARACTGYGSHVTAELTSDACATGLTIISGAAYGVDAVAHRAALALHTPTIAVLAGGADRPYPSAHAHMLEQIGEAGAVCSEMVPGSAPTRWRFLQRNRVIAALSRATLVTEAGPRSGSLNTAGHAAELGRALGAVPGPITSAASVGCHRLIREYGASLVSNGAELRELLGISDAWGGGIDGYGLSSIDDAGGASAGVGVDGAADSHVSRESALHRRVIDALPLRGARAASDVARLAGIAVDEVQAVLAELELLGNISRRETPEAAETHWALNRGQ